MLSTILRSFRVRNAQAVLPAVQQLIQRISIRLDVLGDRLMAKTICPSSQQYLSSHYNLHSMFGYFEAQASNM
jgi:hypothetical protein